MSPKAEPVLRRTGSQSSVCASSRDAAAGGRTTRSFRGLAVGALAICLLALSSIACSVGELVVGRSAEPIPTSTRTPWPTFTPLPGEETQAPAGVSRVRGTMPPGVTVQPQSDLAAPTGNTFLLLYATSTPSPGPSVAPSDMPGARPSATADVETNRPTAEVGPRQLPTPYVVVDSETLNARRGPATTFDLLGKVKKGDELMILARIPDGTWWEVCCVANQPAWVVADQVTARGPVEEIPLVIPPPTPAPTSPPAPTPVPEPTATPLPPFDIARGPEFPIKRDNGILTIWVKVYEGFDPYERPLAGYVLKVSRNGVDVSGADQSFSDRPFDETSKSEGTRKYNLKFEMNAAGEADWEFYLAQSNGYRVSPITKFTTLGDSYRNLVVYVAYILAR